jgi:hypothetical protein
MILFDQLLFCTNNFVTKFLVRSAIDASLSALYGLAFSLRTVPSFELLETLVLRPPECVHVGPLGGRPPVVLFFQHRLMIHCTGHRKVQSYDLLLQLE